MNRLYSLLKKNVWFIIGPCIVLLEIFVVLAIKKVYPFGERTISYYDMSQAFIPFYYHAYDFFHFKSDYFLNWNSSLGTSIANDAGIFMIFPINWIIFFFKRENILNDMSFFLAIKLMIASLNMEIYCFHIKKNKILAIVCSIAYALCSFSLQYYNIITILDNVLLFPLLMLSYKLLIECNKKIPYIITLFFVFILSQHTIFFVCIYLLFRTFIEIIKINKADRRTLVFNIFICSILSFGLSGFVFVPNLLQTSSSARVGGLSGEILSSFGTIICEFQQNKNFMLYGIEFVFSLLIVLLINKSLKKYIGKILLIIMLMIPIFFEGVNLLWHIGSYEHFPMRFSFILVFTSIELLIESFDSLMINNKYINRYFPLFSISMIPVLCIVIYKFNSYFLIYGIRDLEIFKNYWIIFLIVFAYYLFCFCSNNMKLKTILLCVGVIVQTSLGCYGLIAPESDYYPECSTNMIVESLKLYDDFENIRGIDNRLKDVDFELNANYSFITETASASGWVNGTDNSVVKEMVRLGYNSVYLRTLDCGGTALSDALLGYKYAFCSQNINSELYSPVDEKSFIYSLNYTFPFGSLVNDNAYIDHSIGFEHQNQLYAYLGGDDYLFNVVDISELELNYDEEIGDYYITFEFEIPDKSELYIYGNYIYEYDYEIFINDKQLHVPYLGYDNIYFPNYYRNGFVDCGSYNGERVRITLRSFSEKVNNDLQIGYVSLDKFKEFCDLKNKEICIDNFRQTKNKLSYECYSSKKGSYIIPIGYSDNWSVEINGKKVEYNSALNGMFILVYLDEGLNEIEIKYAQKGFLMGALMSTISLISIFIFAIGFKFSFKTNDLVHKFIYLIYLSILSICCLIIYILPITINIYYMFINRISILDILNYY